MKKMFFLMLLVAAAGSMRGQEPKMVVTGNMVNTGALTAEIPIDLRTNAAGVGRIDNEGDIKTPALNVGAETLLNNEGDICVGYYCTAIILTGAAKDYSSTEKGDVAKEWTSVVDNFTLMGTAYDTDPASTMVTAGDLMLSQFVYSSNNSVLSKSPGSVGTNNYYAYADLKTLNAGIMWKDAVPKCANLTEGGYSDWYLPNYGETLALADAGYLGYSTIGSHIRVHYWSSTESTEQLALTRYFTSTGAIAGPGSGAPKANTNFGENVWLARCVRRI